MASDRTYGACRVWHDVLAEGMSCGLHRIERLMRSHSPARPAQSAWPAIGQRRASEGCCSGEHCTGSRAATAPNQKWIADFAYIWTAEGWAGKGSAGLAGGMPAQGGPTWPRWSTCSRAASSAGG